MLISHEGKKPRIDASAWVSPGAVVSGDVSIGAGCRVLPGAVIAAEDEFVEIGDHCIVLENAVLRSTTGHPLAIGNHCLVGPNAHIAGCTIADEVFIATGASIFHGAEIGRGSEVRINGVVHVRSVLPPKGLVPIGWVAVGRPAEIMSPDRHEDIWAIQKELAFAKTVYGISHAEGGMKAITWRLAERLKSHRNDEVIDEWLGPDDPEQR